MRSGRRVRGTCRETARHLHAYLDGELSETRTRILADHLADCDDCGSEAELHRVLIAAVNRLRVAHDPLAMSRLQQRIEHLVQSGSG